MLNIILNGVILFIFSSIIYIVVFWFKNPKKFEINTPIIYALLTSFLITSYNIYKYIL